MLSMQIVFNFIVRESDTKFEFGTMPPGSLQLLFRLLSGGRPGEYPFFPMKKPEWPISKPYNKGLK